MSKILFNILGYFFKSLGEKSFSNGDLPSAEKSFSRALSFFDKTENYKAGFDTQINLGDIYKMSYLVDVATEVYNGALALAKKRNDKKNQAVALINIAMLYALNEDYENSKKTYESALELADEFPETKGQVLHGYGVLEQQYENYEKSAELLNASIDAYDTIDLIFPQGLVYQDMGEVYNALNNEDGAKNAWGKALMVYQRNKDNPGMADIFLNMGQLLNRTDYIKQAMDANQEMGRDIEYANCCTSLALIYIEEGEYKVAVNLLSTSIDIEQNNNQTSALIRDYANMAMLYSKMNNQEQYQLYLDEAMKVAENTNDEAMKKELVSFFALDSDSKQ